ncbi:MAG: 4Fe-4S binding protein [Phycisphaerales bacterium]|jgi:ferredoxin|nr:4Fe-4S binding protein [Phycisphaerales bacterium]MBT7172005.1 4Fe-4S binding protein [Phycisphaerales bacterium]
MLKYQSRQQRIYLLLTLLVAIAIIVGGWAIQEDSAPASTPPFSINMSIKQIAPALDVTGKSLARELDLPLATSKNKPLKAFGITQKQLDHATHHIASHRSTTFKYYIFTALALFGLVYLIRLGRPDNSTVKDRELWYPSWLYIAVLILSIAVCGFALGKSPNPMEGTVKVFKSMAGLYPSVLEKVLGFIFFAILSLIGTKLICGWACPFGALQELLYRLPMLRALKKRKVPFVVSNTIRSVLFVLTLLILFGIVGNKEGFVLYHFVNPFNLFNLEVETLFTGIAIGIFLLVSLGVYRPFCHFICPFGLLSWILERFSLFGVRINRNLCTDCGACDRACPSEAARGRVQKNKLPADCFSCGRCLNACPTDAIRYALP